MAKTSRREFLRNAGSYGAAAGVGLAGGLGLARGAGLAGAAGPTGGLGLANPDVAAGQTNSDLEAGQSSLDRAPGESAPETSAVQATHPFGYPEDGLDVERTRQLGYEGFKGIDLNDGTRHAGCAFGVFHAIIGQLAEVVGAPYNTIPTQMMDWAGAGVVGFGTLCGTLNGAAAAIGLICSGRDARGFISDLMTWYSETPLPTNLHAPTGDLPQSSAASNLCHVSLTRWCRSSGFASGSPERAERCSRLAGDVAAKAVEMLNEGTLGLQVPSEKTTCRSCHYMGDDYAMGQFTHGEMNCLTCHISLKEKSVTASGH